MKPLSALESHRLKMLFEHVDPDRTGVIDIAALTRGIEDDAQVRDVSHRAPLPRGRVARGVSLHGHPRSPPLTAL